MKEKDYNLELIRIISFISVIGIHVANYYCRSFNVISNSEYIFSLIINTLARISVPCFFMISGALLLGRQEPLIKHYHRIKKFILVLIVWSIIYYLWNVYYLKETRNLIDILHTPVTEHLWYLYGIIPIYFVLPFFQVMCQNLNIKQVRCLILVISIAVVCNYLFGLINERAYYDLPLIGDRVYAFYFLIGYYLYKYKKQIPLTQKQIFLIFISFIIIVASLTAYITYNNQKHYEVSLQYGNPLLVIASIAFFILMIRLSNCHVNLSLKTRHIIDTISSCTFGIYLIHIIFLDIYKKYLLPQDISAFIVVILLTLAIGIISFVVIYLLRLTAIGRKIC